MVEPGWARAGAAFMQTTNSAQATANFVTLQVMCFYSLSCWTPTALLDANSVIWLIFPAVPFRNDMARTTTAP
jgi:hypothetical protein